MSHFAFIKNSTLRDNLDVAFVHILNLIPLSESASYSDLEKSSFRKTIIINTAAIIEALLFNLIFEKCTDKDLTEHKWELKNPKDIYVFDSNFKIVGGEYRLTPIKLKADKLNLGLINEILHDKEIVSDDLYKQIDQVRVLRNDQHFGTHRVIKEYSKAEMEFVFSVANKVKKLVYN